MKINQLQDIAAPAGTAGTKKAAQDAQPTAATAQTQAGAAATPAQVKVTVSSQVRSLEESITAGDGVDAERVQAMREAIANGTFKVDAEAIADKLLANAQEILSRARR